MFMKREKRKRKCLDVLDVCYVLLRRSEENDEVHMYNREKKEVVYTTTENSDVCRLDWDRILLQRIQSHRLKVPLPDDLKEKLISIGVKLTNR